MSEKLNVAILQVNLKWEDARENRSLFTREIDALEGDVDLILLPEMFTTGFSMNARMLAEEADGPTLHWMQEMARKKNAAITGSVIIKEKGNFYNRLFFVFPNGSYKKYDKRHTFTLAKEDQTYTAGTERLIVEYEGWKICPLICYDLRFPVWARNTVDYDLLIYVANWPKTRVVAWDVLLKARAIENMSYCIGVNRVGIDGDGYEYNGHSGAYDVLGRNLIEPEPEEPFAKIISLDMKQLKKVREQLKFLQDRDDFTLN